LDQRWRPLGQQQKSKAGKGPLSGEAGLGGEKKNSSYFFFFFGFFLVGMASSSPLQGSVQPRVWPQIVAEREGSHNM